MNCPEINPDLHGAKPTANCLSYGNAGGSFFIYFTWGNLELS
jgi:hypothetical protein